MTNDNDTIKITSKGFKEIPLQSGLPMPTQTYCWCITKDLCECLGKSRVGVVGPSTATLNADQINNCTESVQFRMGDSNSWMYYGNFVGDNNSEDGFGPLDDLGRADAGCTEIEFKINGKWELL